MRSSRVSFRFETLEVVIVGLHAFRRGSDFRAFRVTVSLFGDPPRTVASSAFPATLQFSVPRTLSGACAAQSATQRVRNAASLLRHTEGRYRLLTTVAELQQLEQSPLLPPPPPQVMHIAVAAAAAASADGAAEKPFGGCDYDIAQADGRFRWLRLIDGSGCNAVGEVLLCVRGQRSDGELAEMRNSLCRRVRFVLNDSLTRSVAEIKASRYPPSKLLASTADLGTLLGLNRPASEKAAATPQTAAMVGDANDDGAGTSSMHSGVCSAMQSTYTDSPAPSVSIPTPQRQQTGGLAAAPSPAKDSLPAESGGDYTEPPKASAVSVGSIDDYTTPSPASATAATPSRLSGPACCELSSSAAATAPPIGLRIFSLETGSDFNDRFQLLSEELRSFKIEFASKEKRLDTNYRMSCLFRDFAAMAKTLGRIIISEKYIPDEQKTIKRSAGGVAGGEKYISHGIYFKFAVDVKEKGQFLYGGTRPDDARAAKVAGHELKSLVSIYNCESPFALPLMALIDYRGFRLVAMSLLPIAREATLVMGSQNGGRTIMPGCPEVFPHIAALSETLNLQQHHCGANSTLLYTCLDMEIHIGSDRRFYIIDLSRTFPPESPPRSDRTRAYLYELLRPEFVRQYSRPLCSDAYSNFLSEEDRESANKEVAHASDYLHKLVIPKFAIELVDSVYQAMRVNELASFSLKTSMHSAGINLRHMGRVLDNLVRTGPLQKQYLQAALNASRMLVIVEMMARAICDIIAAHQRTEMATCTPHSAPSESKFLAIHVNALRMLSRTTPDHNGFWGHVAQVIFEKYDTRLAPPRKQSPFEPVHMLDILFSNPADEQQQQQEEQEEEEAPGKGTPHKTTTKKKKKKKKEETSDTPNPPPQPAYSWHRALLKRVLKLTGCKLHRHIRDIVKDPGKIGAVLSKLYDGDVSSIDEKVKDMNLVSGAEGYILKLMHMDMNDPEYSRMRSVRAFERSLVSQPNNSFALRNLAQLAAAGFPISRPSPLVLLHPQLYKAMQLYHRALICDQKEAETLQQVGDFALRFLGDRDKALEAFTVAAENDPTHMATLRHLLNLVPSEDVGLVAKCIDRLQKLRQSTQRLPQL